MNEQIGKIEQISDRKRKKEMIDGKIYLMASPCREHREVQFNLANIFNNYFKSNKKRCRAIFEDDIYINENNYLVPDLKVLCRENDNDSDIPVIVIEILSKSTQKRDLGIKMKKYAELGIKEYWIITWELSSVAVYLLTENNQYEFYDSYALFTAGDKLDDDEKHLIINGFSSVLFPELEIKLADVFDIFK